MVLETNDVITRLYIRKGMKPISLFVAYANNNRRAIHRPEICLKGAGWYFEKKQEQQIPSPFGPLDIMRARLRRGSEEMLAFYWYKTGSEYTSSYLKQQFGFGLGRLWTGETSCAAIQISTEIKGKEEEEAERRLVEFAGFLLPHLSRCLP